VEIDSAKIECTSIQSAFHGDQIVARTLDELRPHPSYIQHHLAVSASKLSTLAERSDLAFREPLVITRDGVIIDGYARWILARQQGRPILTCIEHDLSQDEALIWLLQRHSRSTGMNAVTRILLALGLESCFRHKAKSNQRAGGQFKGSSNLTEAEKLDVRAEVAAAAGASVGNVNKVKQLISMADSELWEALRIGEISIHRAWNWSRLSMEDQRAALRRFREDRGIKKFIRSKISRHRSKKASVVGDLANFAKCIAACKSSQLRNVSVAVVKAEGETVFITETLLQVLESQQMDLCATNDH
jgi:hypothetical protein